MHAAPGTPPGAGSAPETTWALSASLHRLARLRDMLPGDWSDGPQSLLDWANRDGEDTWGQVREGPPAPMLRGRFDDVAPLADGAPDDEIAVGIAFSEDRLTREERRSPPTDDEEPIELAYGSVANLVAWLSVETADAPVLEPPPEVIEDTLEGAVAFGSAPLFDVPPPATPPTPDAVPPVGGFDEPPVPHMAFGSAPLTDVPAPLTAPETVVRAPQAAPPAPEPLVAPGAIVDVSALADLLAAPPPPAPANPEARTADDDGPPPFAFGALADLCALVDAVPADEPPVKLMRAFDPKSLVDDALADACDALLAPVPIDPDDVAWTAETLPGDPTPAVHLMATEAALWDLPRHTPCIETFQSTPNHETAVKLTRALRLRAHALEARAFAENVDFGALQQSDDPASALWFPAVALGEALAGGDADVDASLPDWTVNADGLVVVVAPGLLAPPLAAAQPLITEAELDALLERVEESHRVILDDLGDEDGWSEPYWSDVDSYLARVSDTTNTELLDTSYPHPPADMYDIEIRDAAPEPPAPATHFWMPGDDDISVTGDGDDLFVVCGGDQGGVVLVEDGATWSMRTGGAARMDEIVVSLSHDPWRDVDSMAWRRIATLSGVGEVRIEQNARASRRAVMMGAFLGTGLDEDAVRLMRTGDDGEEQFPVIRYGADDAFAAL